MDFSSFGVENVCVEPLGEFAGHVRSVPQRTEAAFRLADTALGNANNRS